MKKLFSLIVAFAFVLPIAFGFVACDKKSSKDDDNNKGTDYTTPVLTNFFFSIEFGDDKMVTYCIEGEKFYINDGENEVYCDGTNIWRYEVDSWDQVSADSSAIYITQQKAIVSGVSEAFICSPSYALIVKTITSSGTGTICGKACKKYTFDDQDGACDIWISNDGFVMKVNYEDDSSNSWEITSLDTNPTLADKIDGLPSVS